MEHLVHAGMTAEQVMEKLRSQPTRRALEFRSSRRSSAAEMTTARTEGCEKCGDTGYLFVENGHYRSVKPCTCLIERDRRQRIERIGRRDRWATLARLQACADPSRLFIPADLQAQVIAQLRHRPDDSYAFFGPSGAAKTTYLAALYRHAVETQRRGCFYVQMVDLVRGMRDVELGNCEAAYLTREAIRDAADNGLRPRVFLDEFDKVNQSDFTRNAVHALIDELYRIGGSDSSGAQLVIATNLDRREFAAAWGASLLRRVQSLCAMVDFFEAIGQEQRREVTVTR